MSKNPTTREILNILYQRIEDRQNQHKEKAYTPGKTDVASEVRYSECGIVLAMIVGIENEYNI